MQAKKYHSLTNKSNPQLVFAALYAVFITFFSLLLLFKNYSFDLSDVKGVIISEATNEGIDIGKRISLFYKLIFYGIVIFFVNLFIFQFLLKKASLSKISQNELLIISLIGLSGIVSEVFGIVNTQSTHYVLFVFLLRFALEFLPDKIKGEWAQNYHFAVACLYSFLLFSLLNFLGGNIVFISDYPSLVCFFGLILIILIYFFYKRLFKQTHIDLSYLFLPLSFVPALVFLTCEFSFYIKTHSDKFIPYKISFLIVFALISLAYYIIYFYKKDKWRRANVIKKIIGPSVILNFAILSFYTPIISQQTDFFELANPANSILNVFKFHEFPVLDFMSSHMLSEQWYGYIYTLIFGFNGEIDFIIYEFFNVLIYLLLVYYFLNKLFGQAILSLCLILFFPFLFDVFYPSVFLNVLVFFAAVTFLENTSTKNGLRLLGTIILLIFWRLDTGSSAVFTTIFFVPLLFFIARKEVQFRVIVTICLTLVLLILLSLGIILLFRNDLSVYENFMSAWHYLSANQAHGHAILFSNLNHQFYLYHVFFPIVAVFSCLWIINYLRKEYTQLVASNRLLLFAALFFFISFMANGQRGLVRHGFNEQNEFFLVSTFFLALSLFGVFLLKNVVKVMKFMVFYLLIFLVFISFKYFPFDQHKSSIETGLSENKIKHLNLEFNNEQYVGRVKNKEEFEATFSELKLFLDSILTEKQTFLDFSNSPMLYYYCQREIPGYFNQNLQNTVDEYLQLQLLKKLNPKKVPVVVFSSIPLSWFDQTDGIPNSMRYYYISEYIFKNYKPYKIIANKSVWISKAIKAEKVDKETQISAMIVKFDYKHSAKYIASYYQQNNYKHLKKIATLHQGNYTILGDTILVDVANKIKKIHHIYLTVRFKSSKRNYSTKPVSVVLIADNQVVGEFDFLKSQDNDLYMLRLSNLYQWHLGEVSKIKLILPKGEQVEGITFYKDLLVEN